MNFHSCVELIVSGRPYSSSSQHQPLKMPQNQRSAQFCTSGPSSGGSLCGRHDVEWNNWKTNWLSLRVLQAHRSVVTCLGWRSVWKAIFRDKCGRSSYPVSCNECYLLWIHKVSKHSSCISSTVTGEKTWHLYHLLTPVRTTKSNLTFFEKGFGRWLLEVCDALHAPLVNLAAKKTPSWTQDSSTQRAWHLPAPQLPFGPRRPPAHWDQAQNWPLLQKKGRAWMNVIVLSSSFVYRFFLWQATSLRIV